MSLLNKIAQAEKYSLTDEDISRYLDGDVNIIRYEDLAVMYDLEELFFKSPNVILHIPIESSKSGHWVALFQQGNSVRYFCPYGLSPRENIEYSQWLMHNEDKNQFSLVYLIKKYKGHFSYSPYKIQELKFAVNTCGRHCISRLLHKEMGDLEYFKYITSLKRYRNLNADEVVSLVMLW